jgi:hypothetical protein
MDARMNSIKTKAKVKVKPLAKKEVKLSFNKP